MRPIADKPPPTHRERKPVRECPDCGAYLTSANEDTYCARHGGWVLQRMSDRAARDDTAALLDELMGAAA